MEANRTDLHPPPSYEHIKINKNNIDEENAAFYTPPQENASNSTMMSEYSPDSDPTSRYESAQNSHKFKCNKYL